VQLGLQVRAPQVGRDLLLDEFGLALFQNQNRLLAR
jgi:hypothetical protein